MKIDWCMSESSYMALYIKTQESISIAISFVGITCGALSVVVTEPWDLVDFELQPSPFRPNRSPGPLELARQGMCDVSVWL